MNKKIHNPFNTFIALFQADLTILRLIIVDKTIDMSIWVICNVLANAYVMPYFGITAHYGEFMVAGTFASIGLFEVWPAITTLVSDMLNEKIIGYHLSLPLSSTLVFIRMILFYALNIVIMQAIMLPISIAIVYQRFPLGDINYLKLITISILTSLLYGSFAIYMSSKITMMENVGKVWMRFLFPLWYLGGYHFSWEAVYKVSPALAYLNLLNPMTWVMEGTRGAMLNSFNFLPFWQCCCVTIFMVALFSWRGITLLKKRLDCL